MATGFSRKSDVFTNTFPNTEAYLQGFPHLHPQPRFTIELLPPTCCRLFGAVGEVVIYRGLEVSTPIEPVVTAQGVLYGQEGPPEVLHTSDLCVQVINLGQLSLEHGDLVLEGSLLLFVGGGDLCR